MGRPRTWSNDINLTVTTERYKMGHIHNFIKKCMSKNNDITKIIIKKDLIKKGGDSGYSLSDKKLIIIAEDQLEEEIKLTVLHEIYHVYFHDEDDIFENNDIVEERAENSSINTMGWYKTHSKQYEEFEKLFKALKVEKLTVEEMQELL